MTDSFRGDNAALIENIDSLLRLDAAGALVPHGVGGLARQLRAAAASRLAAAPTVPFCAPDGACSCQKFADDPAACERRFETAAQLAPGEAGPDLLQDLHNELYRAQTTDSVDVLTRAIGKARLLLSHYRATLAIPSAAIPAAPSEADDAARDQEIELTLEQRINDVAALFGSLREAASVLEIDAGYLSRLRSGEKSEPSDDVLKKLGLRRKLSYVHTRRHYTASPLTPRTRSA